MEKTKYETYIVANTKLVGEFALPPENCEWLENLPPETYEWVKSLPPEEQKRYYYEMSIKNVIGLDPSSFKYIKYEDPYARNFLAKCPVCGKVCRIDQYGNGECDNCLWQLGRYDEQVADSVQYPNMVSLNKARWLYKEGKPLKPDFDDFIAGLEMYSEMTFYYKGVEAAVCFDSNGVIHLQYGKQNYVFSDTEEFRDKSCVDGKPLKEIWNEVENADYMQG